MNFDRDLLEDLRTFHGLPPYGGPSNPYRGDTRFWNSIKCKWGAEQIAAAEEYLGVRKENEMSIKKKTREVWVTSDGKEHPSLEDAQRHTQYLDVQEFLENERGYPSWRDSNSDEVTQWLITNRTEIIELLGGKS